MSYDCDNIGCPNQVPHLGQLCGPCHADEDDLDEDDDDYDDDYDY